jgi:hypothetical protein
LDDEVDIFVNAYGLGECYGKGPFSYKTLENFFEQTEALSKEVCDCGRKKNSLFGVFWRKKAGINLIKFISDGWERGGSLFGSVIITCLKTEQTMQAQKDEHKKRLDEYRDQVETVRRRHNDFLDMIKRDRQTLETSARV